MYERRVISDAYSWHYMVHIPTEKTEFILLAKEEPEIPIWSLKILRTQLTTNQKLIVASSSSWRQMVTLYNSPVFTTTTASQRIAIKSGNKCDRQKWNPARARRYTSYEDVECYLQWEISSVHYERCFSGPGYLGEFVEALFMWYWGLPLFSCMLQ